MRFANFQRLPQARTEPPDDPLLDFAPGTQTVPIAIARSLCSLHYRYLHHLQAISVPRRTLQLSSLSAATALVCPHCSQPLHCASNLAQAPSRASNLSHASSIPAAPQTMPKIVYCLEDATVVLKEVAPYLSPDDVDELIALYCHSRFGNYSESAGVDREICNGAARLGFPPVRARTFQLWKRIYRRADDSARIFIWKVQEAEKRVFGSYQLYEMLKFRTR